MGPKHSYRKFGKFFFRNSLHKFFSGKKKSTTDFLNWKVFLTNVKHASFLKKHHFADLSPLNILTSVCSNPVIRKCELNDYEVSIH